VNRDIIVIGASFGGLDALKQLLPPLPSDFPASIFIVLHSHPESPGIYPRILSQFSSLPVSHAIEGQSFERGQIYVAPTDHHLLLQAPNKLRVVHGPRENRFRPAVDPLFRSAAAAFGPRVIGVVLSGLLFDGAAGLADIKECGGLAVVQDPADAVASSMPHSAKQRVNIDAQAPARHMGEVLLPFVTENIVSNLPEGPSMKRIQLETEGTLNHGLTPEQMDTIGTRHSMICAECGGPLWKVAQPGHLRFRCHLGHSYNAESFAVEQAAVVDRSLAAALRCLEDAASLAQERAVVAENAGDRLLAKVHRIEVKQAEEDGAAIRSMILRMGTTPGTFPQSGDPKDLAL
jgi:two-component system chemotaxis response regulator CheB